MCSLCRNYLYDTILQNKLNNYVLNRHIHYKSLKQCVPTIVNSFERIFNEIGDVYTLLVYINSPNNYQTVFEKERTLYYYICKEYPTIKSELDYIKSVIIDASVIRKSKTYHEAIAIHYIRHHLYYLLTTLHVVHFEHTVKICQETVIPVPVSEEKLASIRSKYIHIDSI
jgi:hypothetical protein